MKTHLFFFAISWAGFLLNNYGLDHSPSLFVSLLSGSAAVICILGIIASMGGIAVSLASAVTNHAERHLR